MKINFCVGHRGQEERFVDLKGTAENSLHHFLCTFPETMSSADFKELDIDVCTKYVVD